MTEDDEPIPESPAPGPSDEGSEAPAASDGDVRARSGEAVAGGEASDETDADGDSDDGNESSGDASGSDAPSSDDDETRGGEADSEEGGGEEADSDEADSEIGGDEIDSDEIGTDEIGTDEIGSDEIGTDEIGTDESDATPAASAFSDAYEKDAPPEPQPTRAPSRGWLRVASFGLLTLIGSCLGGIAVRGAIDAFTPEEPPPAEIIEVQPTPDVITAMRDLSRLETASFHVERVVDLRSRQRRLFGLVEANDSILLVAAADVVAGVDLTRMEDGDVVIENDRRVIVTLPPVEIFSARLDNDRTYVYERETDALAQRRENLETRARREAERTLRQAALDGGIEERAQNNARATIEALIRSLGFDEVEVEFQSGER